MTYSPKTRMIFTCVPNAGGVERPHMTVLVTPRLENGDPTPLTLENWEFSERSWTTALASARIAVTIDGNATPVPVTLADPGALDEALWQALFESTSTMVTPYAFADDNDRPPIRSHPAFALAGEMHRAYLNAAWKSPDGPPPLRNPDGTPTDFGHFVGDVGQVANLVHHFDTPLPWTNREKSYTFPNELQRTLYLANRFYVRRPPWVQPPALATPPPLRDLDFHQRVSQLADHPSLLRGTGLVFDVLLPPGSLSLDGTVKLAIDWRTTPGPGLDVCPTTHYVVQAGRFLPKPIYKIDIDRGYLQLDAMVSASQPLFPVYHLDTDGAAHQSVHFGAAIAGQLRDTTRAPITSAVPPTLRTSGLTIGRYNRDLWLDFIRNMMEDANTQGDNAHLFAEHLMRGMRVDVELDGSGVWRSLCRRTGQITNLAGHGDIAVSDHEGYVRAASASRDDAPPQGYDPELYLHEAITGWDGWSLVARRPGKAVAFDESGKEIVVDGDGADPKPGGTVPNTVRFVARYAATPGSLPRLRFGHSYRVRARVVDVAGGGIPPADTDTGHASPPIVYGRYEPVLPPTLVLRARLTDAESVERLVVRTGDPPDPRIMRPTPIDPPPPETCERHVLPPKCTLHTAETHGRLDPAFTAGADARWYDVARKEGGTLLATTRVNAANGADEPVANIYVLNAASSLSAPPATWPTDGSPLQPGQYVVHTGTEVLIPYLPDPLARGLTLVDPAPAADSIGPTQIQVGYGSNACSWAGGGLDDWPEKQSLRLVLRQGTGTQIVRQASGSDARTIVFELPPGRVLDLRYSSWPTDQLGQLALWNEMPDALKATLQSGVAAGLHWMFSPSHDLHLVHATQRPVTGPFLADYVLDRQPSDTTVSFGDNSDRTIGAMHTHSWSTSHVDVRADWWDWIDDPKDPDGLRAEKHTGDAFRVAITAGQDQTPLRSWPQATQRVVVDDGVLPTAQPAATQPPAQPQLAIHRIGDTKHHTIAYTPIGTTRYAEYFPVEVTSDPANLVTTGPTRVEAIPNTATPPAPAVLYAVPTFQWEPIAGGRKRHGRGLRIYLDRPWFASGEGERLAVILPQSDTDDGDPAASRWGTDPAWDAPAPPSIRTAVQVPGDQLTYFAGTDHAVTLPRVLAGGAALPTGGWYQVVGFLPEWNAERGLWYVDVELDLGASYWPFASLSVARWQPKSIGPVTVSTPVRVHFAQLASDVAATVTRSGSTVAVQIVATSASNSDEILDNEPGPRLNFRPRRWVHDGSLAAAHRVFARFERLAAGLDPNDAANQLRWAQVGAQVELRATDLAPGGDVIWNANLAAPAVDGALRVVLTWSELYQSDTGVLNWTDGGYKPSKERVVYLDAFAV
jgi:hypothetical protein